MITIDYELQDMIISALRYAIGRRTYITEETCSFIKNHPEIINNRVKTVMLRDLENIKYFYKDYMNAKKRFDRCFTLLITRN